MLAPDINRFVWHLVAFTLLHLLSVFTTNVVSSSNWFYSTCPTGFNLLSCGNSNYQTTDAEVNRRVLPLDSKTCQCYDYFGMNCIAWCTTLPVPGYEVRSSNLDIINIAIGCSSGRQVLGCHLKTLGILSEKWRKYYPVTSGGSCACYDFFGANCIASCGTITNYEVVSVWSSGYFSVSCSDPTNRVLGCGINPGGTAGNDWFRFVTVNSGTSCICYDGYGAYCYAVCGKIW